MPIAIKEYQTRRTKLLKSLEGAAAVVLAGEHAAPDLGRWTPESHFYYLTGIADEPGAAVLFDPTHPVEAKRVALLLRPRNPETEQWDGYRDPISSATKTKLGFATIYRTTSLPRFLTDAARRAKKLACLEPFASYPAAVSGDLVAYRQVAERVLGVSIVDQTQTLLKMRAVKSANEVELIREAVAATAKGFASAVAIIRPGVTELQVENTLHRGYQDAGAESFAYTSIVGGGLNSTVLHYIRNDQPLAAGEVVLIDSAAKFQGYCADVTRTYPVSGKFTADQREVYEVVLKSLEAATKAVKPGVHPADIDAAARKVIDDAGYADYFIHGAGHPLGIDVHDSSPDGTMQDGWVITIEPGIYLPDRKLGIRIEDDILVTARGSENLTRAIPKSVRGIEALMSTR